MAQNGPQFHQHHEVGEIFLLICPGLVLVARQISPAIVLVNSVKMDEEIINRFYRLYKTSPPDDILPMNIQEYGNSSVACIPTLFDIVRKENYKGHKISKGDVIMFASVGAGMNVNAITYEV